MFELGFAIETEADKGSNPNKAQAKYEKRNFLLEGNSLA